MKLTLPSYMLLVSLHSPAAAAFVLRATVLPSRVFRRLSIVPSVAVMSSNRKRSRSSALSTKAENGVPPPSVSSAPSIAIYWFRNALRLHDNPSLLSVCGGSGDCGNGVPDLVLPVYVWEDGDRRLVQTDGGPAAGRHRTAFVLESLSEISKKISDLPVPPSGSTAATGQHGGVGSRVFVLRGDPRDVLAETVKNLVSRGSKVHLVYECEVAAPQRTRDGEVIMRIRDELGRVADGNKGGDAAVEGVSGGGVDGSCKNPYKKVKPVGKKSGALDLFTYQRFETHGLHADGMERYLARSKGGAAPGTYGSFRKIFDALGPVPPCCGEAACIPPAPPVGWWGDAGMTYDVPGLEEFFSAKAGTVVKLSPGEYFPGGEDEALRRLTKTVTKRSSWAASFEKPKTSPNALDCDTTGLSPYVKHGCLSPRKFYHALSAVYAKHSKHSQPPVSLHGQLLWREYNYLTGYATPLFDKMEGNPVARNIPWDSDEEFLEAWRSSRTGYPFIDALMTQLRETGWLHHLGRHAVACFLTRGDLWQSWVEGAEVFEEYLIDADWAINNFNWQWLSCTAHFHQFFRCYSPVAFPKKTDKKGDYIRKWLPQFRDFPARYIYEPWEAPLEVQKKAGVVVGVNYPKPIVDHKKISKENMGRMKLAFDAHKAGNAV
eukprot:CAMPEP_0194331086 /NCGR_PEP_ID=MMETSP0171-20130528/54291_1 /TAXON_ID=218684 /ORGANISM="Corethron pennatum, Strain L29A3" /LENGTH=658 /DNA_ID=CAMNT_0039092413 /DNA_START=1 /DNA_END=1978 /DNA_ORIENTATION=-